MCKRLGLEEGRICFPSQDVGIGVGRISWNSGEEYLRWVLNSGVIWTPDIKNTKGRVLQAENMARVTEGGKCQHVQGQLPHGTAAGGTWMSGTELEEGMER